MLDILQQNRGPARRTHAISIYYRTARAARTG